MSQSLSNSPLITCGALSAELLLWSTIAAIGASFKYSRVVSVQVKERVQANLLAECSAHSAAVTAVAFGRRSGGAVFVTASSDRMLKVNTRSLTLSWMLSCYYHVLYLRADACLRCIMKYHGLL